MRANFKIYDGDERRLEKAIRRLNKHAQRMGYGEAKVVSIGKPVEDKKVVNFSFEGEVESKEYVVVVRDVEVDMPEQFLNPPDVEWQVVGQVVSAEGQAEVVAAPANMIDVAKAGEGFNWKCAACNHALGRAFVVRNKVDGRVLLVGVECLKQYTGADGQAIIAAIEFVNMLWVKEGDDASEYRRRSGRSLQVFDLDEYLAVCCAVVRRDGGYAKRWVWNDSVQDNVEDIGCTRNVVLAYYYEDKPVEITDADKAQAEALVKAWQDAPVLPRHDDSKDEYAEQCKFLAERGWVTEKTAGVAASMVKGPRVEKPNVSQYLGEVGKRQDFRGLKVVAAIEREGDYGISTILKFEDAAGNVLTWFASGCPGFEKDAVVDLKATVKAHEEYRGVKQTVISRAKELAKKEMVEAAK